MAECRHGNRFSTILAHSVPHADQAWTWRNESDGRERATRGPAWCLARAFSENRGAAPGSRRRVSAAARESDPPRPGQELAASLAWCNPITVRCAGTLVSWVGINCPRAQRRTRRPGRV